MKDLQNLRGEELRKAMREEAAQINELRHRIGRAFEPIVAETHLSWLHCQEEDPAMMVGADEEPTE